MTFDDAEARFRELQSRVQRGEPISRAEYEDQVGQLAVQDDRGVLWEINPRTGKWMYFDGAEWVGGTPPGRDHSTVMPAPKPPTPPTPPPPTPRTAAPSTPTQHTNYPPLGRTSPLSGARPIPPLPSSGQPARPSGQAPRGTTPSSPEAVPPYVRVSPEQGGTAPGAVGGGTAGGSLPARLLRQGPLGGPNREWVPLAIGAVVLLLCAVILFFGGRFVLAALGPAATPTRANVISPLATNTPVPTVVRLPTAALPTSTPAPVLAKVIENKINVRSQPSTKGSVLTTLAKNAQISLVAQASDGQYTWYQINVAGQAGPGWVRQDTIQIVSGDPKMLPPSGGAPAPAPTKAAAPAAGPQTTATLTPIGARPPGQ